LQDSRVPDETHGTRGKGEPFQLVPPATDPKSKRSKPFAHPKHRAAFILIGDPNVTDGPPARVPRSHRPDMNEIDRLHTFHS